MNDDCRPKLLITDLDDTLYDWMAFYIPSFLAMAEEVHRITGVDIEALKSSFQQVHRRHGTTEYAFSIQELDVLQPIDRGLSVTERLEKYESAIRIFRSVRKKTLKLFPSVKDTLVRLRDSGITLVALSDSMMSYVSRRLRQLDIDELFTAVCAPRDHGLPEGLPADVVRKARPEDVEARVLRIELPPDLRKPDVALVRPVLERFRIEPRRAVCVGDSLSRDVLLAKRAGLVDVWAKYGQRHDTEYYRELLKITYWTTTNVEEEERLRREVSSEPPTNTIEAFSELLSLCKLSSGIVAPSVASDG